MKSEEFEKQKDSARKERTRLAYGPLGASLGVNLLLFILKLGAGIISGSVAIIADAWHTVSDSLTTAVVFLGFKITGKKPDENHPYGHERAEKIAAIVIGVILFAVGAGFFITSLRRLIYRESASFGATAIWVLIFSVAAKEAVARYSIAIGRKIKSDSLVGDGWHHRSDALSSGIILAGIIVGRRWWWLDGALGAIIAIMLFKASYEIVKKTSSSILGEAISGETREKLKKLTGEIVPEAGEAHHFHLHSYGSHRELSFHISLPGDISLKEAHQAATRLEGEVRRRTGFEPTIHVDHQEPGDKGKE